jgi:hypothetical protein
VAFTETLTQRFAFMGQIASSNHAANTDTSIAGIDMFDIRRLMTILDVGVVGASANIQVYYRASATANMASPTNVAGSIPLTCNTSNRIDTLEVRADQLPAGTRYVQPVMIINTAASNVGVIVLGDEISHKPGSALTIANTVDQGIVT